MNRKPLAKTVKALILSAQNNSCIYCGVEFILLTPSFDHFIPWAWHKTRRYDNYVASCQMCNNIKSDKLFESVQHASDYIRDVRVNRGLPVYKEPGVPVLDNLCKVCGLAIPFNSQVRPRLYFGRRCAAQQQRVLARERRQKRVLSHPSASDSLPKVIGNGNGHL